MIAGLPEWIRRQLLIKYDTASFEMSLQLSEYGYVEHKPEYWLKQEWPDPSRIESLEKTLGKQLDKRTKDNTCI